MGSAGILEVVVPEKATSAQIVSRLELPKTEPVVPNHQAESHTRELVIGGLILGTTMLGAMGGSLLIWAFLR